VLKNKKTTIYKCIACYGVVGAGIPERDATNAVVVDFVTGYCVVAGIPEADAANAVVVDFVACYAVVGGTGDADAISVVADSIV